MCHKQLPAGYALSEAIDLKANKKLFWTVNGLSLVLAAVCLAAGYFIVPFPECIGTPLAELALALCVMAAGIVAYIVLHELTHGVFLYAFTKVRPKFGFVGWAAYCGNTAYCDKPRYLIVALAPLVFWGAAFGVLTAFFHTGIWFWTVWAAQTVNLSGSAGDLVVFCKILKKPKNILVNDTGLQMSVYAPAADAAPAAAQPVCGADEGENT